MLSSRTTEPSHPLVTWAAVAIGATFTIPGWLVLWRAFRLDVGLDTVWTDLRAPLWRTIQLATLVSATAAVVGTGLAWLLVRTDLPLRRMWRLVLVLPLGLPSFVGAAAFIAGVSPDGLLHEVLGWVGITPPRRLRGLGISWLVLTAFTYPYVLLPVSARLLALRPSLDESARLLGRGPVATFVSVTLPQLRSAIVGGSLLVYLYCVSEFGAVQLLGYDTLTRVVFATRLADRATSFGAAAVLLVLAIAVVSLERWQRGPATIDERAGRAVTPSVTLGWKAVPATLACATVALVGLVTPVASLALWAQRGLADGRVDLGDLVQPAWNTAVVSVTTAIVAVAVVVPVAVTTTQRRSRLGDVSAGSVVVGFALPGLVIALALTVVTLNTPVLNSLYQTTALLVFAYVVHFGSQALASVEQSLRAVPGQLRESSRLLDASAIRRIWRVDAPLMRPGLLAGAGLVLLSTVKELPATLLLAPTGFSTLATKVWGSYEDGFYAEAGAGSIALIVLSGVLTWFLVLRRSALVATKQ
ncbi:MAG: iron ABC transporter permease [Ilumatobacter sp.]|uniref:ABC transporter permease n=1 Tax=Ilumatobacter sp. TaxID=1967498 RepID=UPI002610455B|nr:iron ABC transporter permease [Ilumatobacter sp.]MDJ0767474.1 iron ABC transporter permease [Ilumatobacter sp.]